MSTSELISASVPPASDPPTLRALQRARVGMQLSERSLAKVRVCFFLSQVLARAPCVGSGHYRNEHPSLELLCSFSRTRSILRQALREQMSTRSHAPDRMREEGQKAITADTRHHILLLRSSKVEGVDDAHTTSLTSGSSSSSSFSACTGKQ